MRHSHLSLSHGGKPVGDGWFEKSDFKQAIGLSSAIPTPSASSLIVLTHLILCLPIMASRPHLDASARHRACDIQPTEIYCGTAKGSNLPVKLRIATGGAGQSGLLRALADAFIDDQIRETKCPPFAVAWIKSDTTASFNHLADSSADLSITYNAAAEQIAIAQGIADKRVYAWRDHFLLVGMYPSM